MTTLRSIEVAEIAQIKVNGKKHGNIFIAAQECIQLANLLKVSVLLFWNGLPIEVFVDTKLEEILEKVNATGPGPYAGKANEHVLNPELSPEDAVRKYQEDQVEEIADKILDSWNTVRDSLETLVKNPLLAEQGIEINMNLRTEKKRNKLSCFVDGEVTVPIKLYKPEGGKDVGK